jgi:hypothetical protein
VLTEPPRRGGADSSPVVSDAELGSSTAGSNSSSIAVVGEAAAVDDLEGALFLFGHVRILRRRVTAQFWFG